MITSINHMSFTVRDLDQAVRFYHEVLGLEIVSIAERPPEFSEKATGVKGAHLRIAYLKSLNGAIELIQYLAPPGGKRIAARNDVGSSHVCFNVADFSAMVQRLQKHNAQLVHPPLEIPAGPNQGKRMLYFEDPDGNTLEFIEVLP
ncbi:MAG TPA: VOC family protein [Candidatus Nanoarchaeia archaeon]|nr:VOC family protein [Candidatus Nanoarchaeia archaeon]